jgi:hypothetical protein
MHYYQVVADGVGKGKDRHMWMTELKINSLIDRPNVAR